MNRTIDKIITEVNGRYGAPMGRSNRYPQDYTIVETDRKYLVDNTTKESQRIFDCAVPMSSDGAYDRGGAYWGIASQLRVSYTKDLSYVEFYRVD